MIIDLSKKLGQMFFVGFEGYTLTKEIKHFLEIVQPGGIIFFECNIKDKKQVKKLIRDINDSLVIKPFIAVDQEGGAVERLRKICTSVPSVWGLSKIGLKELLEAQKIIAEELRELGFNMNFVPVLDINSNPKNPIIGTRAISDNPKIVSEYGSEVIKLFLKNQIIPVAKHFPGHGDLDIDSHLSLPVLSKDKKQLNNFELIPFKKAIQIKTPVIMAGHIQIPSLERDKRKPTSLSKAVLDNLLRKELGFKGLIVTDELNMKGITKNFSLEEASLEAINAGVDLLLFNYTHTNNLKIFNSVFKEINKNKYLQKRIDESYKRILQTKNKLFTKVKVGFRTASMTKNRKTSLGLAEKGVHWVKRELFFKPISFKDTVEVIYPETHRLRKEDIEAILRLLKIKKFNLYSYSINPSSDEVSLINKKLNKKNKKMVITYDVSVRRGQKLLVEMILETYPDLVVISVGLERDVEIAPKIKNFISAYAPNYISLKAAFNKLFN